MSYINKFNISIIIIPLLIFTLGLVTLLSIAPNLAKFQLVYFFIGVVIYLVTASVDYTFFRYYWVYIYIFVIVLLVLTSLLGTITHGSVRWLDLGFITIQPSEFAKAVIIFGCASLISARKFSFIKLQSFVKLISLVVPVFLLVFLQPDLGTSLIIICIGLGMMFVAGLHKLFFVFGFILIGLLSQPIWNLLKDYQKERILVFLNPSLDLLGSGYNVTQSLIAIGSGQLFGRGFGRGTQSHLQFLPVYWTDFIFASFSEEWGFVGVILILVLYLLLLLALLYLMSRVKDIHALLLLSGIFIIFFVQFAINVGMNLGLLPVTGIPLPLVSYGGSSLLLTMFLLGLVQSIWIHDVKKVNL